MHAVEEDSVVVLAVLVFRHHVMVHVGEGDGEAREAGCGVGVGAGLGQVLRWRGIRRVLGGAAAGDDEGGLEQVEYLVGVGVGGVGGAGEGVCLPDVDQGQVCRDRVLFRTAH